MAAQEGLDWVLNRAKAILAACAAAAVSALAGVDWQAIVAAAVATGGAVERIPNPPNKAERVRKRLRRNRRELERLRDT